MVVIYYLTWCCSVGLLSLCDRELMEMLDGESKEEINTYSYG